MVDEFINQFNAAEYNADPYSIEDVSAELFILGGSVSKALAAIKGE